MPSALRCASVLTRVGRTASFEDAAHPASPRQSERTAPGPTHATPARKFRLLRMRMLGVKTDWQVSIHYYCRGLFMVSWINPRGNLTGENPKSVAIAGGGVSADGGRLQVMAGLRGSLWMVLALFFTRDPSAPIHTTSLCDPCVKSQLLAEMDRPGRQPRSVLECSLGCWSSWIEILAAFPL